MQLDELERHEFEKKKDRKKATKLCKTKMVEISQRETELNTKREKNEAMMNSMAQMYT